MVLEVLAGVVVQENNCNGVRIRKEDIKLPLFTDNVIVYVENPKESTKKKKNSSF